MASAASIAPSETKAYCFRILGLVFDGGTAVLRHQFDSRISQVELQSKLNDQAVRRKLNDLRRKNIITQTQWDILYPQINAPDKPCSSDFDVTLLNLLLRWICDLDKSSKYWSQGIPPSFDTSIEADLSRLRRIRNEVGHIKTINLTKKVFEQKWDELKEIILRLGTGIPDLAESIQKLSTSSIDPENEAKYMTELQQSRQNEFNLLADVSETKSKLFEVEGCINNIAETVDQQTSQLNDVAHELKDVEERTRIESEKHDSALKVVASKQTNLEANIVEERKVRETQHVHTAQRFGALDERIEHLDVQRNLQAFGDLSVEDEERDQLYVITKAHTQAKDMLLNSGIVVLCGSPGEGKTMMATKLISEVANPGSCLKLNQPSDMRMVDLRSNAFEIIFIDDIFGTGVFDEDMLREWSPWFPDLLKLVHDRKRKRKLVITSRHYIMSEAKQKTRSKLFDSGNIQTLSSSQLSVSEMKQILELHLRYFNRSMDEWTIGWIVTDYEKKNSFQRPYQCVGKVGKYFSTVQWESLKTMTGYPETVRLFASNDDLYDQGQLFFKKPYVFFRNCIEELFMEEEKYFALFLIWSMPKQTLNRLQIQLQGFKTPALAKILKAAKWFGFDRPGQQLETLLRRSLSYNAGGILTYHKESGDYSFCHNIAKDMVGIVAGKHYPSAILQLANKEFLVQYTTVNENKDDDIHVFIEPFRYDELTTTIINAMQQKVKYLFGLIGLRTMEHDSLTDKMYLGSYEINISMLKHDCFMNDNFLRVFCNSEEGRDILHMPIACISGLLRNCGLNFDDEKIPVYLASRALLAGNTKLLESFMKYNWKAFDDKKMFLYMSLLMAARVGLLDTVELLLRYGAEPDEESMYIATMSNHANIVERLLEKYTPRTESYIRILNKNSPLIVTAKKGLVDIMKLLIKYGFDVNYRNAKGKSALDKALLPEKYQSCELSYKYSDIIFSKQFEAYKVLIESGAMFTEKTGPYKRTQHHTAADVGHGLIAALLIEKGASLKDKDYRGHYPIHCAAIRGHCHAVRAMLKADHSQVSLKLSSPGSKSRIKGMTLLHIAVWKNNHSLVKLLLEHDADPNIQDSYGRTSFYLAAYTSYGFLVELLTKCSKTCMQQPEKNGMTPLHAAVLKNHKHIADKICGLINEFTEESQLKPLKGRNVYSMAALERAIFNDNLEECEHLLRNGADKSYNTGHFKRTLLHFAAEAGSPKSAELLVSQGASLYAKDYRGYIPIQCAALKGNNAVVEMFLRADEKQAHVKLTSYGKRRTKTMDLYHIAALHWNEDLVDILVQHRVDPNMQNVYGKTPINVATEKGHIRMVKQLLPVADVNLADNNGHTPLHTAIHRLRTDIAKMLCPVSNVNLQDKYGDTPLHKALMRRNLVIFKQLIEECDADIDICDNTGMSVIDLLERKGYEGEIVKFDLDRFLCGSDPFIVQDEYLKIIVAKRYSKIMSK